MGRFVAILVAACVAAAIGYAYFNQSGGAGNASQQAAGEAPEGPLAPYRGKVVLVDFWATWCGPCKAAMPGVQRIHEKFRGKPVAVIGANVWERGDPAQFMADKGYTYELLTDMDPLAEEYEVTGIPTFVVLGPDGELLHRAVGYSPEHEETITGVIEDALARM